MDRSAPLAATRTLSETGSDAAGSPRGHPELLSDQSSPGRGRSREREYQVTPPPRPWLQEPALSATEGPANGRNPDRICGLQESSLKCGFYRIPAESRLRIFVKRKPNQPRTAITSHSPCP